MQGGEITMKLLNYMQDGSYRLGIHTDSGL